MKTFIPADAITPANISQSREPAVTPPFRIPRGHTGGIKGFIQTLRCAQLLDQMQKESDERSMVLAQETIELRAVRQRRKSRTNVVRKVFVSFMS